MAYERDRVVWVGWLVGWSGFGDARGVGARRAVTGALERGPLSVLPICAFDLTDSESTMHRAHHDRFECQRVAASSKSGARKRYTPL